MRGCMASMRQCVRSRAGHWSSSRFATASRLPTGPAGASPPSPTCSSPANSPSTSSCASTRAGNCTGSPSSPCSVPVCYSKLQCGSAVWGSVWSRMSGRSMWGILIHWLPRHWVSIIWRIRISWLGLLCLILVSRLSCMRAAWGMVARISLRKG